MMQEKTFEQSNSQTGENIEIVNDKESFDEPKDEQIVDGEIVGENKIETEKNEDKESAA